MKFIKLICKENMQIKVSYNIQKTTIAIISLNDHKLLNPLITIKLMS